MSIHRASILSSDQRSSTMLITNAVSILKKLPATVGPFPYTTRDNSVEVLYIDHNHLHMVGNVDNCDCIAY